jgi:putative transposase
MSVPPQYSPSHVMKILKGKSAERLRKEFPDLSKRYWGLHLWARGYFVSTVGIDSTIIQNYVKNQQEAEFKHEQFRIWKDNGE